MTEIFIFCDDPSHARPEPVANFKHGGNDDDRWTSTGSRATVRRTRLDLENRPTEGPPAQPDPPGVTNRWWGPDGEPAVRESYALSCRRCAPRGTVGVREERLHAALHTLAQHGVSQISLSGVAAILGVQSGTT